MKRTSNKKTGDAADAGSLPAGLAALIAAASPSPGKDAATLSRAAAKLADDPAFIAECAKGVIVEDVLRAMEASGLNRNTLAAKLGKSRQYVGRMLDEDQQANFTIETLAELACALRLQLHVRMVPDSERIIFARRVTVTTPVAPALSFPETTHRRAWQPPGRFKTTASFHSNNPRP